MLLILHTLLSAVDKQTAEQQLDVSAGPLEAADRSAESGTEAADGADGLKCLRLPSLSQYWT